MTTLSEFRKKVDPFYIGIAVMLLALGLLTWNRVGDAQRSGREAFGGVRGYVTLGQARLFAGACLLGSVFCAAVAFRRPRPTAPDGDTNAKDI